MTNLSFWVVCLNFEKKMLTIAKDTSTSILLPHTVTYLLISILLIYLFLFKYETLKPKKVKSVYVTDFIMTH